MRYSEFAYDPNQHMPVITALLLFRNTPVTVWLPFVIDTAAKHSIVTPTCEARLKNDAPDYDWDDQFAIGVKDVGTILGQALFKYIDQDVGLCFLAEDNQSMWIARLPFILFSNQTKVAASKIIPGQLLPFGIIGQDVLRQCGLITAKDKGILAPNLLAVARIIENLDVAVQAVP